MKMKIAKLHNNIYIITLASIILSVLIATFFIVRSTRRRKKSYKEKKSEY